MTYIERKLLIFRVILEHMLGVLEIAIWAQTNNQNFGLGLKWFSSGGLSHKKGDPYQMLFYPRQKNRKQLEEQRVTLLKDNQQDSYTKNPKKLYKLSEKLNIL